ncbi:helix-turn-helix domain-containing protein [Bradyrhizobium japonicum]|uniref:helix-turn-helix domain-containing protein n=1 Tax=Bradyrhizobium japonicum TaxID=375 RepID=UPI00339A60CB
MLRSAPAPPPCPRDISGVFADVALLLPRWSWPSPPRRVPLRRPCNPSRAELANRLGVDRSYVSGRELGTRNATIVTLWHVSQVLGVTFQELFVQGARRTRRSKGS